MNGIQILLVCGVFVLVIFYIFKLGNAFFDLLILLGFTFLSCFFILFPDYTNVIAHKLGVGRGADLLFYLAILFFLFVILKLFSRLKKVENNLTELVRKQALKEAKFLDEANEK